MNWKKLFAVKLTISAVLVHASINAPQTTSTALNPAQGPNVINTNRGRFIDQPSGQELTPGGGGIASNAPVVVNVQTFGAGTNNAAQDIAGINLAVEAAKAVGSEIYFPAGTYTVSNLTFDASWNTTAGGFINSGFKIRGDGLKTILRPPDTATPVFNFTNGVNYPHIQGISFVGRGKDSTAPLIAISGPSGSVDGLKIEDCQFTGGFCAFTAVALSDSYFINCEITGNRLPFVFRHNASEANNNNHIIKGFIGGNDGGAVIDEASLTLVGVEGGGLLQTNFFVCTNGSGINLDVQGGNFEIDAGAFLYTTNATVKIHVGGNSRVVDASGGAKSPYFLNATNGGVVTVIVERETSQGLKYKISSAQNHTVVDFSASAVKLENPTSLYTNVPGFFRQGPAGLGDITPGQEAQFNKIFTIRDDNSVSHWSETYLGIKSNETVINIDLSAYYKNVVVPQHIAFPAAGVWADITAAASTPLQSWQTVGGSRWRYYLHTSGSGNYIAKSVSWMNEGGRGFNDFGFQVTTNDEAYSGGSFMLATNYVAGDFIPVDGKAKLCLSNGFWYSVTRWKTNLFLNGN